MTGFSLFGANRAYTEPRLHNSKLTEISGTTRFCAVYGHPIKHSASPAMQNAGIETLGLNWRYLAFDVHPDHLREAIAGAKAMKFIGLNLTVPHKLLALEMVDLLDESAREWGAVNTIRFESETAPGAWRPLSECAVESMGKVRARGFNTDAEAIIRALEEELNLNLKGGKALVLGAGGAGRTASLKLAAAGIGRLHLVNRTMSKVAELRDEIHRRYPATEVILGYGEGRLDLVMNATSLGLNPDDPLPFDPGRFDPGRAGAAYDMIYRPAETRFLKLAGQAGCKTANGMGMLLYQGAKALEIWSGKPAPVAVMRGALAKHLYPVEH